MNEWKSKIDSNTEYKNPITINNTGNFNLIGRDNLGEINQPSNKKSAIGVSKEEDKYPMKKIIIKLLIGIITAIVSGYILHRLGWV